MDIETLFEQCANEDLRFEKIKIKFSKRSDLHAFILLDKLFPENQDIIGSAEHDKIWLNIDDEQIQNLSKAQILELSRCGIFYDEDSLCMFV